MMSDYLANVREYDAGASEAAVAGIVKHLGIALRSSADAALVAASDPAELARVRTSFLKKKLARNEDDAALDAAIDGVMKAMAGERQKSRVTVYYLLAKHFGQLSLFGG